MSILINLIISAIAVYVTAYILPGVELAQDFGTILIVTILLGIANAVIKPILTILTLPITLVTFGLFALVINALMVLLVDGLVEGFSVGGFLSALVFSIVLSIISSVLRQIGE